MTRRKEIFKPLEQGKVRMYVCGPTVYGPSHLGHARTYVAFDVIRRYLLYKGYKVKYVVNITDVHDDMINEARSRGIDIYQLTDIFLPQYLRDMRSLNVLAADVNPRVTENIKEIIKMTEILVDKEYAYMEADGSVYFNVAKFKNYGKLSGMKLDKSRPGLRVQTDKYEKENSADFALWKAKKAGEPFWDSPWGKGRPGWHIECSVMARKHLGKTLDIHAGAVDLKFPHHENEIAQSEAANEVKFVNYWLHTGLLKVNGQKMAKSLGNYIEIPDLLKKWNAMAVRYFLLATHYRSSPDFTEKGLKAAENALENLISRSPRRLGPADAQKTGCAEAEKEFEKAMDDDFNTAKALAVMWKMVKDERLPEKVRLTSLLRMDEILGLNLKTQVPNVKTKTQMLNLKKLLKEREKLRKEGRWKEADKIREKIEEMGYILEDTEEGPKIKIK